MPRLNLLGGTYLARSLIANAQSCINLYPEKNPQDASAPYTHQLTPGLVLQKISPNNKGWRALYTATNGSLFGVAGNAVLFVDPNFVITVLGNLGDNLSLPIAMQDNGNVVVITDGQPGSGWAINLQPNIAGVPMSFILTNAGTGGGSATFSNVPLTGGTGTGAIASLVQTSGGAIIDFQLDMKSGQGYVVGDVLSTTVGGLSGVTIKITNVGAQINAFGQITDPNFLGSVGQGYVDTFLGFNQPNTKNFYTSLSNITYSSLVGGTSGSIALGTIIAAGTGGTNGSYAAAPFIGGSGSGGTATVTVAGNVVTSVVPDAVGQGYAAGDVLTFSTAGIPTDAQYSIVEVNAAAFDPLYVAAKVGYPDLLATIVNVHREWWLMGAYETAEVWYDAGGTTFPFQIVPGVFIQHGTIAPYSVATHDLVVLWLGIDNAGLGTVFMGAGYQAKRISTYAIEKYISTFLENGQTIADAIGMVYKQQDHVFYVLTFPTADKTLVYDLTEGLWHERAWTDPDTGLFHRIRANCMALAYTKNVCGDWQNGNLYVMDLNTFTDNGNAIVRQRDFPHILNDGKRLGHDYLQLDLDCGNGVPSAPTYEPQISLLTSDDRGKTFTPVPMQSFGAQGEYLVQVQWRRLGMARDRVYRVTWSEAAFTALQGAWLGVTASES